MQQAVEIQPISDEQPEEGEQLLLTQPVGEFVGQGCAHAFPRDGDIATLRVGGVETGARVHARRRFIGKIAPSRVRVRRIGSSAGARRPSQEEYDMNQSTSYLIS